MILNILKLSFSGYQYNNYQVPLPVEALTTYEVSHHSKDKHKCFKCNLCPYSTRFKKDLKRHFLVHSGERPHKCKICNRSFALLQSLKSHILTHTGEKPYSCNMCDASFTQLHNLKKHMNKHM